MAAIHRNGRNLVCISGKNIAVSSLGSQEKTLYQCERTVKPDPNSQDGDGSDRILAASFSSSGKWFVTADDWKQLTLWQTGDTWTIKSTRVLVRRCTALIFTQTEDTVLVADKSGDVYSFSVSQPEEPGKLLLGHISMLVDIALCGGDKFVVTGDRDEKIRVSCYPNTYNIHAFCLAHKDFVSRLIYVKAEDILMSGSGDGSIKLWNYREGQELASVNCLKVLQSNNLIPIHVQASSNGEQKETESQPEGAAMETDEEPSGGSGGGEEVASGEQSNLGSVRCMVHHNSKKLLAVTFSSVPAVVIFKLKSTVAETTQWSLDVHQIIAVTSAPWDICLDDDARLWVLQPHEGATLQVFTLKADEKFMNVCEQDGVDDLITTVTSINKDWSFFQDSLNVESIFKVLHKARIDNMKEYIARKQERMEEQKRKRLTMPTETSQAAPTKKSKE